MDDGRRVSRTYDWMGLAERLQIGE